MCLCTIWPNHSSHVGFIISFQNESPHFPKGSSEKAEALWTDEMWLAINATDRQDSEGSTVLLKNLHAAVFCSLLLIVSSTPAHLIPLKTMLLIRELWVYAWVAVITAGGGSYGAEKVERERQCWWLLKNKTKEEEKGMNEKTWVDVAVVVVYLALTGSARGRWGDVAVCVWAGVWCAWTSMLICMSDTVYSCILIKQFAFLSLCVFLKISQLQLLAPEEEEASPSQQECWELHLYLLVLKKYLRK